MEEMAYDGLKDFNRHRDQVEDTREGTRKEKVLGMLGK